MPPKKKDPVAPAPEKEFDLFASQEVTEAAPIDQDTIAPSEEEAAAAPEVAAPTPEVEAPKEKKPKAAPVKECNEACPKFHRPDKECVECFNKHFRR